MGEDIVELFREDEPLRNKIASCGKKWLDQSKAELLKQIDDGKRANLIMSRMEKQMKKQFSNNNLYQLKQIVGIRVSS